MNLQICEQFVCLTYWAYLPVSVVRSKVSKFSDVCVIPLWAGLPAWLSSWCRLSLYRAAVLWRRKQISGLHTLYIPHSGREPSKPPSGNWNDCMDTHTQLNTTENKSELFVNHCEQWHKWIVFNWFKKLIKLTDYKSSLKNTADLRRGRIEIHTLILYLKNNFKYTTGQQFGIA